MQKEQPKRLQYCACMHIQTDPHTEGQHLLKLNPHQKSSKLSLQHGYDRCQPLITHVLQLCQDAHMEKESWQDGRKTRTSKRWKKERQRKKEMIEKKKTYGQSLDKQL